MPSENVTPDTMRRVQKISANGGLVGELFGAVSANLNRAESRTTSSYFTFGYEHVVTYGGRTCDCDTLLRVTSPDPRSTMVEMFGQTWGFQYPIVEVDQVPPRTFGETILVEVVQLELDDEIVVSWP